MRACWLKWVGRDWSISADYIWLNYSDANSRRCVTSGASPACAVRTVPIVMLDEGVEGLGPRPLAFPGASVLPLLRERPVHELNLSVLPGAEGPGVLVLCANLRSFLKISSRLKYATKNPALHSTRSKNRALILRYAFGLI